MKDPEDIPDARVTVTGSRQPQKNLTTTAPGSPAEGSEQAPYPITGEFNNIVLFDKKTEEFTTVFEQRVAISSFQFGWRTTRPVVAIFAAEKDTDGEDRKSVV